MQRISPFLWFDTEAEAAARFYVSIFDNSRIKKIARYGTAGPGEAGSVMTVDFELDAEPFTALNGGPQFPFTEAVSFVVSCTTQAEVDRYWEALTKDGKEVQCGWLKDNSRLPRWSVAALRGSSGILVPSRAPAAPSYWRAAAAARAPAPYRARRAWAAMRGP